MERFRQFLFRLYSKILNFINVLSVNAIRLINMMINMAFVLVAIILGCLWWLDRVKTDGYYLSYLTQLFLSSETPSNIFFTIGNKMSLRPMATLVFFILILSALLLFKRILRSSWTRYARRYSFFHNGLYVCFSIIINTLATVVVVTFSLNMIIAAYVDGIYEKSSLSHESTYEDRRQILINEIHENQAFISMSLQKINFDLDEKTIDLDSMTMEKRETFCLEVNALIDSQNGPQGEGEHLLRNKLNYEPETLGDLFKEIEFSGDLDWVLLPVNASLFHMSGGKGLFNLKFVSSNGIFEAVYNKEGELLTADNDPDNMGTYNFASAIEQGNKHATYDVAPYYLWGNIKGGFAKDPSETVEVLDAFAANREAVEWHDSMEDLIESLKEKR